MKPSVYLETTFVSYAVSWMSRDLVTAGHQQVTRDWWKNSRKSFRLYSSQIVIDEASAGDPEEARKRLELLENTELLQVSSGAELLADMLIRRRFLPKKAAKDALHIAVATVHGMDFLLTWNCTHLNNAVIEEKIRRVCFDAGYVCPVLCTPEELNVN